jgi:hypothetical protein
METIFIGIGGINSAGVLNWDLARADLTVELRQVRALGEVSDPSGAGSKFL